MTSAVIYLLAKSYFAYHRLVLFLLIIWIGFSLCSTPLANDNYALEFGKGNAHVKFEKDSMLGLRTFTIETWFKIEGPGSPAYTGDGGITAIPLVAKGRDEAEGDYRDLNYFLGIYDSTHVLVGDFEDEATGENHPIIGATFIPDNIWHHAALTYDGSVLRLFLNGILEAEQIVNETPRYDSIQHAALATAKNSYGIIEGHFDGVLDEVRIWDYARIDQDIYHYMNWEIINGPGLVARYGFNEGYEITVYDSSGNNIRGTIVGVNWRWTDGAPLESNHCPEDPLLIWPLDGVTQINTSPSLEAQVSDPDADNLSVTFYGRIAPETKTAFTIVVLPDTQYYSESYPQTFTGQTQWAVNSKEDLNTVFLTHLGDIVDDGDCFKYQWINANNSMSVLDGILPYGILPGNHDMDIDGVAKYYDQYFPSSRYENEIWYGEGYRNNKNSYQLFSIGSLDFIILHLEYNPTDDVLAWANNVLDSYSERRAIVSTHDYLGNNGERNTLKGRPDGNSGEEIWQKLIRSNCNVFMVLCGHVHWPKGESRLTSTNDCGHAVHQILQNYQHRLYGGSGFLRYYTFAPSENKIYVYTYSTLYDIYEKDENSEFMLDYPMGADPFETIDTKNDVPTGSTVSTIWENINYSTEYEWHITINDGLCITTGSDWSFTTEQDCSSPPSLDIICNGIDDDCDGPIDEDFVPTSTSCGQGECEKNTGETICQNGMEFDTCDPYEGASEEICDGLDNDCDGLTDEEFTDTDQDGWKDCVDPDDDEDAILDEDDNCPLLYNPTQSDFDADQEGDFCDLNDDLIYVCFNEPNVVEWQEEAGFESWNVYKNDLDVLKEFGIYTANPNSYPFAERHCELSETQVDDVDSPPSDKVAFFLVTGMAGGIESSLGHDSEGNERPNDNPCP